MSINVLAALVCNTFYLENKDQVFEITFICEVSDNNFDVTISSDHSEYKWVGLDNIDSIELSGYMKKVIDSSKKALEFKKK